MEAKQYLYVLKLIPRLLDETNWSDTDNAIVGEHFAYLQMHLAANRLILAGRTLNMDDTTMGLVIFEADSDEAAREMMVNDPAVKNGIMTAELFPYRVALMRGNLE